jgi:hypothetical protein
MAGSAFLDDSVIGLAGDHPSIVRAASKSGTACLFRWGRIRE